MSIAIRQLTPVFAGEVSGIDITRPLGKDEVAAIDAGMDRYAVLVFHGQQLTDQQQQAFSRHFGELEVTAGGNITKPQDRGCDPDMADVSNLDKDHKPLARDDRKRLFTLGNRLWHSDSSFRADPGEIFAAVGPHRAGHRRQHRIRRHARRLRRTGRRNQDRDRGSGLRALDCSIRASTIGFRRADRGRKRTQMRPVRQRAGAHASGHRAQDRCICRSHIGTIVGWPMPEARAFIRDLTEHATQRQFVYAHRLAAVGPGDVGQPHDDASRARRYDELTQVRDMRRTTIRGDGVTAAQHAQASSGMNRRHGMNIRNGSATGFVGEVSGIDICTAAVARRGGGDRARHGSLRRAGVPRPAADRRAADVLSAAISASWRAPSLARWPSRKSAACRQLELGDISNFDHRHTRLRARDDARRMYALGNRLWHSDASFRATGADLLAAIGPRMCRAAAATPSSPTCAPPTMRWTTQTKARDRRPGLRTFDRLLARRARLRRLRRGHDDT